MPRITFRTLLAIVSVALLAAVPAIAHKSSKPSKTVGTIVSYNSTDGTLVVSSGGLPVTGKVTGRTEIRWDKSRGHHRGHDDRRRGDDDDRGHKGRSSSRGSDDDRDDKSGDDRRGRHGSTGGLPNGSHPTFGGAPSNAPLPPAVSGLTAGGIVTKAKLKLTAKGPVWDEIKLARPAAPAPAG